MKNIHTLPTDKASNLLLCIKDYVEHKDTPAENSDTKGNFRLGLGIYANTDFYQHQHIYITSNEKIKGGDWCYHPLLKWGSVIKSKYDEPNSTMKKIILTTDQDLIKDGVQSIDDEFLEWFVKNPNCDNFIVSNLYGDYKPSKYRYEIIIPKEEPKQETLEEAAKKYDGKNAASGVKSFIAGAKWQQEQEKITTDDAYNEGFENGKHWQQERMHSE